MKPRDTSMPVLVLHLHHGTLGIARSLGRWGVPVYGMGTDPHRTVSSSRYFREIFPWDFREAGEERSVEEILRIGERIGGPALLLPAADHLVLMAARFREALVERFVFSELSVGLVDSLSDKKRLYYLATEHGIPTPSTLFPTSEWEVERFAESVTFPVMLKGIDGNRLQLRTGQKMVRVNDPRELLERYRALEDPKEPNLMLQEFIPGGEDSVWMFNGFFDEDSSCLMGFTGKKLHQFPPYKGATSLGIVLPNPTVHELTLRFARSIGYRGILDIGFRYDARDGVYKLLDPNPRIGSTFRLFVGADGMDVVRAEYLHRTGQPVPDSPMAEGRKWMVEDWEIDSIRAYARDRLLTPMQWLRDVRGVKEFAWWALDDMRPFFRLARHLLGRGLRWSSGRVSGREAAGREGEARGAVAG